LESDRLAAAALPFGRASRASGAGADDDMVVARLSDAALPRRAAADPGGHVRGGVARQCESLDYFLADHPAVASADAGACRDAANRGAAAAVRPVAIADRGWPQRRIADGRVVPFRIRVRPVGAWIRERRGGTAVPDHPCGDSHPILGDRPSLGSSGWPLVFIAAD